MHSGLGLILNRNKSLFKGLLDNFSGASAAYSLRRLAKGEGEVVRVRRASDNAEQDFSAAAVASGAMTDWVNAYTDLPLDVDSGAAAAYSLRNLKASYTGDVVEVRRSSDDAEESFTAAEVADGTLESWVGAGNDGHVKTWYDQSGNTNDATQTDTAKQPKIVEGGSLLADGVKFDGTDDGLRYDGLVLTSGTFFSTSVVTHADGTNTAQGQIYGQYPGNGRWYLTAAANDEYQFFASCDVESITQVYGFIPPVTKLLTAQGDGSNFIGFSDGLNIGSDTYDTFNPAQNNSDFTIGFDHDGTRPFDGSVAEIIIYNSDQSDNRIAIEANIGDYYGINLPAGVDSGNNEVDGFVTKWYDQSGNGNDVVQTTAANQPKIVNSGSLVTGGMRFDDNQFLETVPTFTYGSGTTLSTFITNSSDGDENAYLLRFSSDYIIYNTGGGVRRAFAGTNANAGNVTGGEELWTTISELNTAGGTSNFYVDGTLTSAADAPIGTGTVSNRVLNIGGSGATTHWNGTVNEVILYATDQSSNRTAIEANIADEYGITLP
jgi:hypothetical protein